MLHKSFVEKISLVIIAGILCCGMFVFVQAVSVAERNECKSILFVKMLAPGAAQIPEDYVDKVGDNVSNRDELSCGTLVHHGVSLPTVWKATIHIVADRR